jgi:hypothetical protein
MRRIPASADRRTAVFVALAVLAVVALAIHAVARRREPFFFFAPAAPPAKTDADQLNATGSALVYDRCRVRAADGTDFAITAFDGLAPMPNTPNACYVLDGAGDRMPLECRPGAAPLHDAKAVAGMAMGNVRGEDRCVVSLAPGQPAAVYRAYETRLRDAAFTATDVYKTKVAEVAALRTSAANCKQDLPVARANNARLTAERNAARDAAAAEIAARDAARARLAACTPLLAAAKAAVPATAAAKDRECASSLQATQRDLEGQCTAALTALGADCDSTLASARAAFEERIATIQLGTVDCKMSPWTATSVCNPASGTLQQTRTVARKPANDGEPCSTVLSQSAPCAVDCTVSGITLGACNPATGLQLQTRTIAAQPKNGGKACPSASELSQTVPCAVDCTVSGWSNQTGCSPASGQLQQWRSVTVQPRNGGKACPPAGEMTQTVQCPVDCQVSGWSGCSASCGGGSQTRSVTVQPRNGGAACPPASSLVTSCNNHSCAPPPPDSRCNQVCPRWFRAGRNGWTNTLNWTGKMELDGRCECRGPTSVGNVPPDYCEKGNCG